MARARVLGCLVLILAALGQAAPADAARRQLPLVRVPCNYEVTYSLTYRSLVATLALTTAVHPSTQ